MVTPLIVFGSPRLDDHVTPAGHPEHQARLDAVFSGITEADLDDAVEYRVPTEAPVEELARVHDPEYVAAIEQFCADGGGHLDADTSATPGSWMTARRSAGAVLGSIEALRANECDLAFAAGRPPGHHAVRDRAMGFCLFNNAAVGAAAIVAQGERVAIVDWDVHHGNGTQDIFYDDPDVLYVSTHQSPLYPGTGFLHETGGTHAAGTNLNLPVPASTAGDTLRAAFDEVALPVIEQFDPDWLIISAGFDAHRDDPLAGLRLTSADYADYAVRLQALVPARRVIVVLEGGYDERALAYSTGATLSALLGGSYRPEPASTGETGREVITAAKQLWDVA